MLAVKEGGGKLGGVPVNVRVEDDALKPANAKQIADKMVQGGVRLFTGVNFSNVMAAVGPTVLNAGGFYVSLNAGPSNYAGKACNPNYFAVAFQNDSYADTAGIAANELGAKVIIVPTKRGVSARLISNLEPICPIIALTFDEATAQGLTLNYGVYTICVKEFYTLDHLPISITLADVLIVGASAMLLCFLATLYPARQASRLQPAEALRYE